MKPFRVNRNAWHYKLNKHFLNERGDNQYYMEDNWERRHNNFCSYWRITMLRLTVALAMAVVGGIVLFLIGFFVYENPIKALQIIASVIGIIVSLFVVGDIAVGVGELRDRIKRKTEAEESTPDSLFMTRYKSYKSKICPSVEYDE
jgi:uncharacterized membrane protein YcjF (UPF0283 family)